MIHSFPYTPDCLALSTWVAAEDGDADALAMLAAEAQGKQQQQQQQQAANGLQGGMQLQHAMYGLPEQQGEKACPSLAVRVGSVVRQVPCSVSPRIFAA